MKKKVVFILIFLFLTAIPFNLSLEKVYADELTTSIEDQLKNLDLQDLEDLFSSTNTNGLSFIDTLYSMLKGEYNLSFTNFFGYLLKTLLASVYNLLPTILIIIALSILSSIINSAKSKMLGESVSKIINFVFSIPHVSIYLWM